MRVQQSAVLVAFLWQLSFFTSNASEHDAPKGKIRRALGGTPPPPQAKAKKDDSKTSKQHDARGLGESV